MQTYLGDSNQTVSVYAEIENGDCINGGLPLVVGFDLSTAQHIDRSNCAHISLGS